jgi:hypothetical protein
MKAVCFVRYVQLARRTMMTLIGNRWNNGLIETANVQFTPGIR